MSGLDPVLLSYLLSLSLLAQVTPEPAPALDKWDFAKRLDFGGDKFRNNRLTNSEDQEGDSLHLTGKLLPISEDVEPEEPDIIQIKGEESFSNSLEAHHFHENPSSNTPRKIDSKSFEGFFKAMFSSTTTAPFVPTTSTISTSRFGFTKFGSYSRFGSSSSQTSSILKSSDIQTAEPTTPPPDVLATVASPVLVSSTIDTAFSTTSFSTSLFSSSAFSSTSTSQAAFRTSTTSVLEDAASTPFTISTTRLMPTSDVTGTVASKALVSSTAESVFSITTNSIAAVSSSSVSTTMTTSKVTAFKSTVTSTTTSVSTTQFLSGSTSISTRDEKLVTPSTSSVFTASTTTFTTTVSPAMSKSVRTSSTISSTSMHVSSGIASSLTSDIFTAVPAEVLVSSSTDSTSSPSTAVLMTLASSSDNLYSSTASSKAKVSTSTDPASPVTISKSSPVASVSSTRISSTSVEPLKVFDLSTSGLTEFSTSTSSEPTEFSTSTTPEGDSLFPTLTASEGASEFSTSTISEGVPAVSTLTTSEGVTEFSTSITSVGVTEFSTPTTSEGVTEFSTSTTSVGVREFSTSTTSKGVSKFSTSTTSEGASEFPTVISSEGAYEFSTSTPSEGATKFSTSTTLESVTEFTTITSLEGESKFPTLTSSEGATKFPTLSISEGVAEFSTLTITEGVTEFSTSTSSEGESEFPTPRSTEESLQTTITEAADHKGTETAADIRVTTETSIAHFPASTVSSTSVELLGETRSSVPSTSISTPTRDTTEPSNTVAVTETGTVSSVGEDVAVEVVTSNLTLAGLSSTNGIEDDDLSEAITEEIIGTATNDVAEVEQPPSEVIKLDLDIETTTEAADTSTSLSSELHEDVVDEPSKASEVFGNIDISATLPPSFVASNLQTEGSSIFGNDENIVKDDLSAFLPAGFVANDLKDDFESTKDEKKGSDDGSKSGLLSRGFFPSNDANIVKDDIASLPPGFSKSRVSSLQSRYKSLHKKTLKGSDEKENIDEKPETDLSRFGRVTTTTVDPISEILANVVILDVANYLPKGYDFSQVESEVEEINEDEDVKNINYLLIRKEDENKSKFKPGKLNGKKLAAIAKELKEADRYYSSVGEDKSEGKFEEVIGVKEMPESSSEPNKPSLKLEDKNNENERNGKLISDSTFELSAESIFASILGGEEIKIDNLDKELKDEKKQVARPKKTYGWREPEENLESSASDSPSTKSIPPSTTSTPRPTTTSTPRPTTPGVCGDFCNLAGTIFIKSGLEWSEELLYPSTEEYKDATKKVVREMTSVFGNVYFGSAFEFASVEAFSTRDGMVLVDIYVQFSHIVFNITTKDVKESFEELLTVESSKKMMGMFEIDMVWTYFMVVDTTMPLASMTTDTQGVFLPDWALLVAVVGVISTFIVAFLGVIMGINKYRHNQVLKTRVLNPKTLQQFRGQRHFDTVEVDHVTAYANDKRDMWTLQKANQEKRRSKSSLSKKFGYADSGRGSSSTHGGKGFYERFPSLGKGGSSGNNHNDSNAELLAGFDNSGFNSSGEILEKDTADRDTSYENEEDDYEVRLGGRGNAVYRRSDAAGTDQRNLSRADLLHSLGEQGMDFGDSDSSLDAVSEGPSERF